AGIVLSGDLERSEGAPVTVGESLFEVAPLDRLEAEIEITQQDIDVVRLGQAVTLNFHCADLPTVEGEIRAVHPCSEIRDNKNVFVATVSVDNTSGSL